MQQPELFERKLEVKAMPGLQEPRLWVRRLAIWEEPGKEPLRDIPLRPGLNIVWTPDDEGIGHGGGKTLFCRLLRYCLGEDKFAPEEQRQSIASTFLNGWVGAEVMLNGELWAIARPLGSRRRHYAVPQGQLDELISGSTAPTGMEPFLNAIETSIITPDVVSLVPGRKLMRRAWLIALAWLARDQECRFDHVLDWRSTLSDSDSPARGLNQTEKLEALRAFLGAITSEEQVLRNDIARLDDEKRNLEQELGHRRWELQRLKRRLHSELKIAEDGLAEGDMGISIFRQAAQARAAGCVGADSGENAIDIDVVRQEYEAARNELEASERKIGLIKADIENIPKLIAAIEGEYPVRLYAVQEAESSPCPICDVPIDRVLASQCKLSHKLPDIEECKNRLQKNREDLESEESNLSSRKQELNHENDRLATLRQQYLNKEKHYKKLDSAQRRRESDWYTAKRFVDDVESLATLQGQLKNTSDRLANVVTTINDKRERVSAYINRQANTFSALNDKFDAIIQRLITQDAIGQIRLTGSGLKLVVQMGGDRSTSAIDSLKVVAFDLAALCLGIEGKTKVPAFCVHDSPREADLGLPLYDRLFKLVHELEGIGSFPLFQYIITTTTRPPDVFQTRPWLAEKLSGSPSFERLLRRDL